MKSTFQIVDSPKRDLEWRLLLAYKLSKMGISSYIGGAQNIRSKFLLHGGVLVGRLGGTSGRSRFDKLFLKEIEELGGKIFYFHDEGGAFRVNGYERESRLAYPSDLCDKPVFEKVYFWGQAQRDIFDKESWITKTQPIGSPRFDLYKNAAKKREQVKDADKIILFNTRFSNVQTVKDDPTALSKRMLEIRIEGGELDKKSKPEIISNMYYRWKTSARDFIEFTDMVAQVCLSHPEQQFVLRPHPAEDVEWYRKNFELLENLTIDNTGDVKHIFERTKLLIHSECTTGLEADLQKIPTVNFIPFPDDGGEGVVGLRSIGTVCHETQGVLSAIDDFLKTEKQGQPALENNEREIDYYISNLNELGKATDILAQDLDAYFNSSTSAYNKNYTHAFKVNVFNKLRNLKNKYKYRNVSKKNMWPSKKEIVQKWIELGGDKNAIKVGSGFIQIGK
ncbi:surface carbohydrate biosynthesis protein [Pseudoalteromonas sp. OOF1S-7]|uniref:surface carbohydrate biosynthesis protein n=1 Tax=Pseudoalteromonas sp. OOF1S-7 TaxID=2917757 RepID=UPI001EF6CC95|nr:surface carbohydrate biosynthesis protein [Pseudoalteromonas sp. OOF1S-7]MCG7536345.1 hypothetical protein [Pseudoalteromonas sp. OOF1S-7]